MRFSSDSPVHVGFDSSLPSADWRETEFTKAEDRVTLDTNWLRLTAWVFLVFGVAFTVLVARRAPSEQEFVFEHITGYTLIVLSQFVLFLMYWRMSNHVEIGPGLRKLQTKVPAEDACPVGVRIRQRGAVTGYDEGFMWIEDGTLFFKGLQTVFRINREDVPPLGLWPASVRPNPNRGKPPEHIPIPAASRDMWLRVRLIDPFEDYNARRRAASFQTALYSWLANRPSGSLESLLPPTDVHPYLLRSGRNAKEGLIAGLVLTGINAGLLLTCPLDFGMQSLASLVTVLMLGMNIVLTVKAGRLAWSHYNDGVQRRALFLESQLRAMK